MNNRIVVIDARVLFGATLVTVSESVCERMVKEVTRVLELVYEMFFWERSQILPFDIVVSILPWVGIISGAFMRRTALPLRGVISVSFGCSWAETLLRPH